MVRWLDDDEQRVWRAFLAMNWLLDSALDAQLLRDAGMPHTYYMILVKLSEKSDRSARMSDLADSLTFSQSRLSHAVARLEERGWVRREKYAGDKRGNLAVLTDAGYEALIASAPGHVDAVRENLFDLLTPDQVGQLGEICGAVLEKLDPGRSVPHPVDD